LYGSLQQALYNARASGLQDFLNVGPNLLVRYKIAAVGGSQTDIGFNETGVFFKIMA
jgi:hypothetical protein